MHSVNGYHRVSKQTVLLACLFAISMLLATPVLAQNNSAGSPKNDQAGAAATDARPALKPADQSIKDAFTKSKVAANTDDFSLVISLCEEGIKQGAEPDNAAYGRKLEAWAYNKRGEKYVDAGDDKLSLKDFETAVSLDPTLWKAIHNRGVSKGGMGDIKAALADFTSVIRLNPNFPNAWYNRAELKCDQGDVAGALADYDRAVQLKPDDAGFYNSRGHANYRLGNVREALEDYNRAVRLDPNDAAALVNRGDANRDQQAYGAAAADYREAIRVNPKLGRAYLSAAWLMATCPDSRYRETDKAISVAQKAIEIDGDK
ncbi:MAG TPA: tetratricopeptide repeat protein, partial [Pirellulales bacterium]